MKVAIFINARAPYRKKQFDEIASLPKIERLNVFYTHNSLTLREWEVEKYENHKIVESTLKILLKTPYGYLNRGLIEIVMKNDLIVLTGYEQPTYIVTSIICKILKKPYVIIMDGINPKKGVNESFVNKIKGYILNGSSALFANGSVSRKYLKNFTSQDKIFNQYLTVDVEKIKSNINRKEFIRGKLREKYGLDKDDFIILYSGRVLESKNIQLIIKALSQIRNRKIKMFIAGGGEFEPELRKLCRELRVDITITGFIKQQEELFKHYFIADLFILPSLNEVWGLVINEAMAAGLPIIASNEVGATGDLVIDGVNGFTVSPFDIEEIKEKILIIYEDKKLRVEMEENSKKIIANWTFESSKESFNNMLEYLGF